MRKFYLCAIAALSAMSWQASAADVFPEGFEDSAPADKGWILTNAEGTKFLWSVASYATETAQFPKNIPVPESGGLMTLKSATGGSGFNITGVKAPDNRIVTPEFTVGDKHWLSFILSYNMAMNIAANVPENGKARFEVYVSPTGDSSDEAFTETIYSILPLGLEQWKVVNLDLSKYAGQTIRLAFRNYQGEAVKSFVANTLYIDNLEMRESPAADLKLLSPEGLFQGTVKEQPLSVQLTSNALTVNSVKLSVAVNGTVQFSENLDIAINPGDIIKHEFSRKVLLEDGDNTVTVTAENENDGFTGNNTVEASTYIFPAIDLPFALADDDTQKTQMTSTLSGTTRNPNGWMYMANYKSWVHTNRTGKGYLHTSDAFRLEKGALKVTASGTPTGETCNFTIHLAKRTDDFGDPVGEIAFSTTSASNEGMTLVTVPEDGDYLIAFGVDGAKANEQFRLSTITVEKATEVPDLSIIALQPSKSVLAEEETPFTVTLRNEGAADAVNVKISLKAGETAIDEVIESINAGATVTHAFSTPLRLAAGEHSVTAECSVPGDFNTENNSLSATLTSYAPKALPFRDSFEDEKESSFWTLVSPGSEVAGWYVAEGYEFDGTHILALPASKENHNDWAITPAVSLPAGYKGRVSFYYGSGGNSGDSHIKAYLTSSRNPEEIAANGILLSDLTADRINVAYASERLDIAEEGNYYIAFHATEGTQSLLLEDVRIDDAEEVAAMSAGIDVTGAEYELDPATVSITIRNFGNSTVSETKVAYQPYLITDRKTEKLDYVEETCKTAIEPGAELTYDFSKKLDFSREGTYYVAVALQAEGDADLKNNTFSVNGPEKLQTMQIPALWEMEKGSDSLHGFIFPKDGASKDKWRIEVMNAYDGLYSLWHNGTTGDAENGDMVILNRVYIPAGTYQMSFFWKSMLGQDGDDYKQSFDILIGESPEREAMTRKIFSFDDVTAHMKPALKEMADLTIDKDGYYWIAVNSRKSGAMGSLAIDNLKIEIPQAIAAVDENNTVYEADFVEKENEWQHYHPMGIYAQQWQPAESEDNTEAYMQVTEFEAYNIKYKASWYQAPALDLKAGKAYDITIGSRILPVNGDKPLKGDEAILLHVSGRDMPCDFKEIGRTGDKGTGKLTSSTIRLIPETDGIHYLTLLPFCQSDGVFQLHSFKVEYAKSNGIGAVSAPEGWRIDGYTLAADPEAGVEVYTIDGIRISGNGSSRISLEPRTMYIVVDRNGSHKIVTK